MPPSTRSNRVSAPPNRIYESVSPLAQAQFPPRRQRVYGRTSLGAPLTEKKQGTLTQIGFVNREYIDDEIAEYEREKKRRKVETPSRGGLRAKAVIGQMDTTMAGSRLRQIMNNTEERAGSVVLEQDLDAHGAPIQRLDETSEPSVNGEEPRPKRRRKSRKGIKIGVKIVTVKVESPEVQRTQALYIQSENQHETQGHDGVHMVMESFQAAPSFEEERNFESHLRIEAEPAEEKERRRNRVIPDSDAESDDGEIVYDSNEEMGRGEEVVQDSHEHVAEPEDDEAVKAGSDVDLDEIKHSGGRRAGSEDDLDEIRQDAVDTAAVDTGDIGLDLTREIADSQAESEDEEYTALDVICESQHLPAMPTLKQEATLILSSFSAPSSGEPTVQPRQRTEGGPSMIKDSFSVHGSPANEPQRVLVADSFYHAPQPSSPSPTNKVTAAPTLSAVLEEEDVDIVPSSSAVSIPDVPPKVASMPPPKTPTKPRRTEVPNTGSTGSTISTQSTIRSMTPSSARSKIYNRSPSKIYNRSPLKQLAENNILQGASLDLPRLTQSPTKRTILPALRESQISTQGTPTQRSDISQLSSFANASSQPQIHTKGAEEDEEPIIIPDSPTAVRVVTPKAERNDSQYTADTNSPSRQIHSELSAAMNSDPHPQPPSSGRTIRFMGKVVKDSQADSDDDSDDDDDQVRVSSSPKPVTPRTVRFQSIPKSIPSSPHIPRSSPATASTDTQATHGSSSRPSFVGAETQMRSQWLGSDVLSSNGAVAEIRGTTGGLWESQWLGDLLPESLMLDDVDLSVPPIMDDDSVWDEFGSRKSSIED